MATGIAGRPAEYFNDYQWLADNNPSSQVALRKYIDDLLICATTPNGVFGSKLMWSHLERLVKELAKTTSCSQHREAEPISMAFPNLKHIYLTRRDKVRQAISFWRALQTGRWNLIKDSNAAVDPPVTFDLVAIQRLVERLSDHDENLRAYFLRNGLQPFTIIYEDFVSTIESTVSAILAHLTIEDRSQAARPTTTMLQQADDLTEEWVLEYARRRGRDIEHQ